MKIPRYVLQRVFSLSLAVNWKRRSCTDCALEDAPVDFKSAIRNRKSAIGMGRKSYVLSIERVDAPLRRAFGLRLCCIGSARCAGADVDGDPDGNRPRQQRGGSSGRRYNG